MHREHITGRCFCGAVRFEVDATEKFACFCYCESCQRAAGAAVVAWATYARDSFKVTAGSLRLRHSSPGVTRGHCADCGSAITYVNEKRPGDIDISINCLDDPERPRLRAHIWTEDKPSWLTIGDGLPVYERSID